LLSIHKKYLTVVSGPFKNDAGFMGSLDKACRDFVNRNAICGTSSTKSPELLARFSDALLKKSAKSAEETDLEEKLNSLVGVICIVRMQ
jgi:cullin 1